MNERAGAERAEKAPQIPPVLLPKKSFRPSYKMRLSLKISRKRHEGFEPLRVVGRRILMNDAFFKHSICFLLIFNEKCSISETLNLFY